jgi:hypothetical protein
MRAWFLIAVLVIACSNSYAPKQTDAEKCEEMVAAVCSRNVECAVMLGLLAQSNATARQMTCKASIDRSVDCSGVWRADQNQLCEMDLRSTPCSAWKGSSGLLPEGELPLPQSCYVEVPAAM